jgi:hypothetical protein
MMSQFYQHELPIISAIIPTSGRPSLYRAVKSALNQVNVNVEIIVVANNTIILPEFDDSRVKVIDARSYSGQGFARQLGVSHATGPIIALLDDDDYWEPDKCAEQLRDVSNANLTLNDLWISATGLILHMPDGTQVKRPRLHSTPKIIHDPAEYLFLRTKFRRTDSFIQSSSLMFPKELACLIPFDTLPDVCTDWGWVIAANHAMAAPIILAAGHKTHYDITLPGVSKTNRTPQILAWADEMLTHTSKRTMGDFCATTPLQVTAHFGDIRGAFKVIKHAYTRGKPGIPATVMAIRNLLICCYNFVKKGSERFKRGLT